jgi:predicted DsbA family dithiol-disulfide isomerase
MSDEIVMEVFADYVWPFCWLAEPAIAELEEGEPRVRVVRRAFELRPDPVPTLDPGGEYLTRVWRDSVYPLAERLGMPIRLPPVQPRSRLAHAAARFAATQGKLAAFHTEVFRAFFQRGEDIGRSEVLVALGETVGLDPAALRSALEVREFEAEVVADEELAERLGVHAVPAYVVNRQRVVTGVQTVEELRRLCGLGQKEGSVLTP